MRVANLAGRLTLITADGGVDVEDASDGAFGPHPEAAFARWSALRDWVAVADLPAGKPLDESRMMAPSPSPRQVFAIGLNYATHAAESGLERPAAPLVFTKFQSCIGGPNGQVTLPSQNVDWEVELVVVIGERAVDVPVAQAWSHVAGLTIGQDFSERVIQRAGAEPQYSMGKSYPGFGPTGPLLVTADEFADPDDIALECVIDGEIVQSDRTGNLIFPVPHLISWISAICPLLPGDLIFTGTPDGVGIGRTPRRFLKPGEEVVSRADGIGTMRNTCVAGGR